MAYNNSGNKTGLTNTLINPVLIVRHKDFLLCVYDAASPYFSNNVLTRIPLIVMPWT